MAGEPPDLEVVNRRRPIEGEVVAVVVVILPLLPVGGGELLAILLVLDAANNGRNDIRLERCRIVVLVDILEPASLESHH